MSSKGKTRFGVIMEGQPRELLAVRELGNGDLLVVLRHAAFFEQPDSQNITVSSQRYSVHRSLDSHDGGHLIKQTFSLETGQIYSTAQFRKRSVGGFAAVLFARACPSLSADRYLMKVSSKDRRVMLYEDEVGVSTLFYILVVSDFLLNKDSLVGSGMRITQADFSHFRLTVLSGIFAVPAIHRSYLVHNMTSAPRIGDVKQAFPDIKLDLSSPSAEDIVAEARELALRLSNGILKRHSEFIFDDGQSMSAEILGLLRRQLSFYSDIPINTPKI